ncbi:MAG: prepilin-type N-terminal cleavage/methylation domain-containing protein [Planctomycetota bacterium]
MKRYAFTLIELIVVISIISLLMAILLPVLGSARESARQSVCLSNIRQIGIATATYAAENDGRLPPHADIHPTLGLTGPLPPGAPNSARASMSWCVVRTAGDADFVFKNSMLGPYLSGVSQIGGCPSFDVDPAYIQAQTISFSSIDYGYNGRMLGVGLTLPGLAPNAVWRGFRLSDIRNTGDTILFADAGIYSPFFRNNVVFSLELEMQQPVSFVISSGGISRGTTSASPTIHGRHAGQTANAAWADGHASNEQVRFDVHTDPRFVDNNLGDLFEGNTPNNDWWDGGIQ